MNTKTKGLTLNELAEEITRQNAAKYDFVADTRHLTVEPDSSSPTNLILKAGSSERFPIKQHAIRQMGTQLAIPATFVDRLAESHPDMLAWNINQLFQREPATRMVRVLFDNVRAYLSNGYRPLDNYDFANATLSRLQQLKAEVLNCDILENRLYIKAVIPGIERMVSKVKGAYFGDGGHNLIHLFKPGTCLSNSETGQGSVAVETGTWEKGCSNMAIRSSGSMRKYHVGGKLSEGDGVQELFSDATKIANDKAFWMKVQDLVTAGLSLERFNASVDEFEAAMTGKQIERPADAIKALPNLTATEQDGILASLIQGGDLSQFGMQWAITHYAQNEQVSFERQVQLERLGGDIIELPKTDWTRIAEAA